jgi:hypothetical protein
MLPHFVVSSKTRSVKQAPVAKPVSIFLGSQLKKQWSPFSPKTAISICKNSWVLTNKKKTIFTPIMKASCTTSKEEIKAEEKKLVVHDPSKIPKSALTLGLMGLIPFVSTAVASIYAPANYLGYAIFFQVRFLP